jgi:dipeptidyl aminopeptidase/acylaminoacyl peptidase
MFRKTARGKAMRGFIGAAVALLVSLIGEASAQATVPVEAYGRLPAISDAAISPDGSRVALAMFDSAGVAYVGIYSLDRQDAAVRYRMPEGAQLRGVGWADDERLTYLSQQTFRPGQVLPYWLRLEGNPRRVDYYRHGAVNLTTGRIELLTTNEDEPWADQGAQLVVPIAGDPGFGRMIGRALGSQARHRTVFRVDLTTGRARPAAPVGTNRDTIGFELDEAGASIVRYDSDERTNQWRLFVYDNGTPRLLLEAVSRFGEPLAVEGLLPDHRIVVNEFAEGANFRSLFIVDRANGALTPFFQKEDASVSAVLDPWTRRVVGAGWMREAYQEHYFDADLQAINVRLPQLYPDATVHIASWSRDRKRILLFVDFGMDGGGYYVFEPEGERLRRVGLLYPELANAPRGERQSITYRARDGTRIPAYLSFPPGAARENLPLVLLVHGGPHARDTFDFDWWAAFLASRGYVVLQPNYRGSSGYGQAWLEAGRRQWGGLMQTDVEDGVAALIRNRIVDPARVCIVGASYGGYAALAGATLTPDRYRCAASIAGVSDLERMLLVEARQSGGPYSMSSDWWRASIGDRQEDRDRIRSVSPVNLAASVRIPILLIHGTDDTVVPIDQSRRMLSALRTAGKDVRFMELRGDDHWLSDAPTRVQMLQELEGFLSRNLAEAAPAR